MNINQLAVFHAVAQAGNLTRAAGKLHISQPAVSKQLHVLERSLGMALFHRLSKGVQLTEGGKLLFEYSSQIFALESEAERALADLRDLQRGRLIIGASTTIGTYLLPEIMGEFAKAHPGVELHLEIANTEAIQRRIKINAIDLALTEGVVVGREWQADVFRKDRIVAVAPPGHPLLRQWDLSLEVVCQEVLLERESGSGMKAFLDRVFQTRGIIPRTAMSLGGTEAIKRAVIAGMGLAFVPLLAIEAELRNGELAILPLNETIERPLHRLRLKGKYESRAAREFVRLLRAKR